MRSIFDFERISKHGTTVVGGCVHPAQCQPTVSKQCSTQLKTTLPGSTVYSRGRWLARSWSPGYPALPSRSVKWDFHWAALRCFRTFWVNSHELATSAPFVSAAILSVYIYLKGLKRRKWLFCSCVKMISQSRFELPSLLLWLCESRMQRASLQPHPIRAQR